jgi:thiol-disulfide isomerase/thioredoxin
MGKPVSLKAAFRANKVTLLEFWFYHCPPCMKAFPNLARLYDNNRSNGLGLLAVNYSDSSDLVRKFLTTRAFHFPVVMSGSGKDTDIVRAFKVTAFPTTYAIDQKGKVLARWVGIDDPKNFAAMEETLKTAGIALSER